MISKSSVGEAGPRIPCFLAPERLQVYILFSF